MNSFTELSMNCSSCGAMNVLRFIELPSLERCQSCGENLFQVRLVQGIIYILSNQHMPGLFKVGRTTRSIEDRIRELEGPTGVPGSFVVEALIFSDRLEADEAKIHSQLAGERLSSKEFFKTTRERAIQVCEDICGRPSHYVRAELRNLEPQIVKNQASVPMALQVGNKFVCSKCKRRLKPMKNNKGWACMGCQLYVDREGNPLSSK